MELKGKVIHIGDTQTFASGFQKKEAVILTSEQYPQPIMVELLQDKVDIIDPFKIGDEVEVGINLRGREWVSPQGETKYFNQIIAWKITRPNPIDTSGRVTTASTEQAFGNPFEDDGSDSLPF